MKKKLVINSTLFFFIGYAIYIFCNILLETTITSIANIGFLLRIIKLLSLIVIVLQCLFKLKIYNIEVNIILGLFILAFINTVFFNGGTAIFEILIILAGYRILKITESDMLKNSIIALIVGHAFVILLCLIGVLQDETSSRWIGSYMGSFFEGEHVRHSMGFLASNQIPLTMMLAYVMFISYKGGKIKIWTNIVVLILNYILFEFFGSRVAFLLVIFTVLVYYLLKKRIFRSFKPLLKLVWLSFILCATVSIICSVFYDSDNEIWHFINDVFYNRLRWSHAVLNEYGVNLFGFGLEVGKSTGDFGENIIDNGYMMILLQRGVLLTCLIIAGWSFLMYKAEKEKKYFVVLSLFIIAVASIIDNHLLSYKLMPYYCMMITYLRLRKPKRVFKRQNKDKLSVA